MFHVVVAVTKWPVTDGIKLLKPDMFPLNPRLPLLTYITVFSSLANMYVTVGEQLRAPANQEEGKAKRGGSASQQKCVSHTCTARNIGCGV